MSVPDSRTGGREARPTVRRPIQVLALGNLLYSDDGAGIVALERLRGHPRLSDDVDLVDGGLLGTQVVSLIEDASRLLVLDAVDVGAAAGAIVRMLRNDLEHLPQGLGAHEFGISDLLFLLKLRGKIPADVVLLGIQPLSIDLGVRLSPEVEAGVNRLIFASIRQLDRWKG